MATNRRTVLKGAYHVAQDITKESELEVLLDDFGIDGTSINPDGDGVPWIRDTPWYSLSADSDLIAGTRDGYRTVRYYHPIGHTLTYPMGGLRLIGNVPPARTFDPYRFNVEVASLWYIDKGYGYNRLQANGWSDWLESGVVHEDGAGMKMYLAYSVLMTGTGTTNNYGSQFSTVNGAQSPGWWWVKLRVDQGAAMIRGRYWAKDDDEPDTWDLSLDTNRTHAARWAFGIMGVLDAPVVAGTYVEAAAVRMRSWQ